MDGIQDFLRQLLGSDDAAAAAGTQQNSALPKLSLLLDRGQDQGSSGLGDIFSGLFPRDREDVPMRRVPAEPGTQGSSAGANGLLFRRPETNIVPDLPKLSLLPTSGSAPSPAATGPTPGDVPPDDMFTGKGGQIDVLRNAISRGQQVPTSATTSGRQPHNYNGSFSAPQQMSEAVAAPAAQGGGMNLLRDIIDGAMRGAAIHGQNPNAAQGGIAGAVTAGGTGYTAVRDLDRKREQEKAKAAAANAKLQFDQNLAKGKFGLEQGKFGLSVRDQKRKESETSARIKKLTAEAMRGSGLDNKDIINVERLVRDKVAADVGLYKPEDQIIKDVKKYRAELVERFKRKDVGPLGALSGGAAPSNKSTLPSGSRVGERRTGKAPDGTRMEAEWDGQNWVRAR